VQKGKVVNWDVVQKGDSPADKENNVPRPAHHTKSFHFHFHGVFQISFPARGVGIGRPRAPAGALS